MHKTKTVTIEAEGRDKGKIFVLTEMPARPAEAWADRAFLALAHSGAVNRLSDLLFVLARVENKAAAGDIPWQPGLHR